MKQDNNDEFREFKENREHTSFGRSYRCALPLKCLRRRVTSLNCWEGKDPKNCTFESPCQWGTFVINLSMHGPGRRRHWNQSCGRLSHRPCLDHSTPRPEIPKSHKQVVTRPIRLHRVLLTTRKNRFKREFLILIM